LDRTLYLATSYPFIIPPIAQDIQQGSGSLGISRCFSFIGVAESDKNNNDKDVNDTPSPLRESSDFHLFPPKAFFEATPPPAFFSFHPKGERRESFHTPLPLSFLFCQPFSHFWNASVAVCETTTKVTIKCCVLYLGLLSVVGFGASSPQDYIKS
jgi:hypothetical protein